ncbi:MAG: ABC transporter ATP-binding protein [Caldisericaceae bacterium]
MQQVVLKLDSVTHYFGGLRAVSNFHLDLPEGALWGLIGPNGAGKTTIFNLITGVYIPTEGNIYFYDKNITKFKPHEVVSVGIARTFQNLRIFGNLTVLDNVRIAGHYRLNYGLFDSVLRNPKYYNGEESITEESLHLLEKFNLKDKAYLLAKALPYGELRRLEIARALATHPKLLLLDEPAAGMNPKEVSELMDLILWIRDYFKITIYLIEHHMQVVMGICERIKVMDFGETIAEGTPNEIQNNPRVIEAYLGRKANVKG